VTDSEFWLPVWTGMALGLLREGYCSMKAVVKWAKENKYPLPVVSRAIDALAIERF
jgi:hypothetical protein